jgi:hypothetical protein
MNGKFYAWMNGAYQLLTNVRDVTLTMESAEADVTTRGNDGWRANVATLKEATIEFEMIWDNEPTTTNGFACWEFSTNFLQNIPMDIKVLDENEHGLTATCSILTCTRSEALEEPMKLSIKMKPTYTSTSTAPSWS